MSNRVHLERLTVIHQKNKQAIETLRVFSDDGEDSYTFFELPKDDLECLKNCIETQKEEHWDGCKVLQGMKDQELGISIDDTFYSWDEIKHLFEGWNDDEDD